MAVPGGTSTMAISSAHDLGAHLLDGGLLRCGLTAEREQAKAVEDGRLERDLEGTPEFVLLLKRQRAQFTDQASDAIG